MRTGRQNQHELVRVPGLLDYKTRGGVTFDDAQVHFIFEDPLLDLITASGPYRNLRIGILFLETRHRQRNKRSAGNPAASCSKPTATDSFDLADVALQCG